MDQQRQGKGITVLDPRQSWWQTPPRSSGTAALYLVREGIGPPTRLHSAGPTFQRRLENTTTKPPPSNPPADAQNRSGRIGGPPDCHSVNTDGSGVTFALLAKNLPHRFQNLSDEPGKVLCVQSPGGVEEFFEHMNVLARARPPHAAKIRELAERFGIEFLPQAEHR